MDILEQLHASLSSGTNKNTENIIGSLTTILSKEIDSIGPFIVSVFHESYGLLQFIKKATRIKKIHTSATRAIEVIHTLVLNFPQELSEHNDAITETCLSVVHCNTHANSVQKALLVIELMIEKKVLDEEKIKSIYDTINRLLINKSGPTVTEKYLDVIGSIIDFHPGLVEDEWKLQSFLIKLLRFSVDQRSPPQQTITGIFTCLRKFLKSFNLDPDYKPYLYKVLQQYSKFITDVNRKNVYRAALNLLEKHMNIFSDEIFQERESWSLQFRAWVNSSNHDDIKAGYGVLYAFYEELGNVLQTPGEDYQNALKTILVTFREDVMDKSKLKLSVKVLGYLGKAIKINLPEELSGSFLLLLNKVEYTFLRDIDSCENSLDILPDFIKTLSAFCTYVEEVSPNHAECLRKVSVLMIRLFPKVSNIHHKLVINSLISTFSSIKECRGYTLKGCLEDVVYPGILWSCSHNIIEEVGNNETTYKSFIPLWIGLINDKDLQIPLFDELIKVLLIQIRKLNLDIQRVDDSSAMDPVLAYKAVHLPDHIIFVNIVNLYVELLGKSPPNLFKKWFSFFIKHVLKKLDEHPLISGFYKLLAIALKISDKINYSTNDSLNSTLENIIKHIIPKIKQYKGDLQLSVIQVILAAPTVLIKDINADYTQIFVTVFNVGRLNLEIAELGVDTLQRWLQDMPQHKVKLMKILPMLDTFLRTQAIAGVAIPSLETRKSLKSLQKRKVIVDEESPLTRVQRKILCFIGEMNSEMCYEFVKYDLGQLTWEEKPILKVDLPYSDYRLKIYLDKFVPRTLELALFCSNRKIKFTACEFFHSLVMIFLGEKTTSKILFEKIAHGVLVLGCDEDLDVQKLFSPLCLQLMHYYSSKGQINSDETEIILETLFEGISNTNDVKLRDFCGQCLKEFVLWTNKQHSKVHNLDKVIDTLKYYIVHPDPSKRLGAALIFNNIYVELRENEHYINLYWLDLFINFINSAEMLQEEDYIEQVYLCLDRFMRVFVEKSDFFQKPNSDRKVPKQFKSGNLEEISDFLLKKTSSVNDYCRRKCMELFIKILRPDIKSLVIEKNSELFFGGFMHCLSRNSDIRNCSSKDEINNWLQSIKCLLEGYTFVLKNKLFDVEYETSQIFDKIDCLLKYILASTTQDEIKEKSDQIFESLIEFYSALLQHSNIENFITKSFCEFISLQIFNFNSIKPTFIDLFLEKISQTKIQEFITTLENQIVDIKKPPRQEPSSIKYTKAQKDLIQGLLTLQKTKLNEEMDLCKIYKGNIKNIFTLESNLDESFIEYCELLLELSGNEEFSDVFTIISNESILVDTETGKETCFGYYIFKKFQKSLKSIVLKHFHDYLLITFESSMSLINIYYIIIDTLSSEENLNFDNILGCIVNHWNKLQTLFDKDFGLAVELLTKLNSIGKIHSDILLNWAMEAIKETARFSGEEKFEFVNRLVQIFGFVVPIGKNIGLRTSLDLLLEECKEIFENNIVATTLTITKLFEAAKVSNSIELLRLALFVFVTSNHNVKISEICTLSLDSDNKIASVSKAEILEQVFEMALNTNFDQKSRIILSKYLSYLLETVEYQTFEDFFTEYIAEFLDCLKHLPQTEEDYTKKINYFILIEILCFRIDQTKFTSKTCPITKAGITEPLKKGTELLGALIKISRDVSKENPPENEYLKESFRLYQCFAYNTLIYVICNTQKDMNFYKFLFKNQENNLWAKIININITYAFQLDVDQQPKCLKTFLNIRSEKPVEITGKYLESQHLFNSTLSEDICLYDFSDITVRNKKLYQKMSVELLEEDLNKHECMEAICGLIKHMFSINLMSVDKVPTWVETIKDLLMDNSTPANVKYFFGQVFVNTAEELKVYGNILIGSIFKLASCLNSINSLFYDLIYVIIEVWTDVEINDSDKEYASDLIKFLMQNAYDETRAKFKKNLQFLKILIERFKGSFIVPCDVVQQKLNFKDSKSKEIELGIQIVNILLTNGIPAWNNTMKDFIILLKNTLNNDHRSIYTIAAETIGITLNFIEKHEIFSKNFERVYNIIVGQLKSLIGKDSMFDCLAGIGRYFPQICDEFMENLLSKDFLSIEGSLKCTYLKICYGRLPKFLEFNGINKIEIERLLEDYNEEVPIITLEMINNSMEYLCNNERELLKTIIKKLATLSNHKSSTCRNILYEIVIYFYNKFVSCKEEEDLVDLCKEILLKGLKEKDDELQLQIYNFWCENYVIPKDFNHRLTYLLTNMFYSSTQEIFLGYNSKILLDIFTKSKEYDENVYTNALIPNTSYEDFELTTNWGTQTMSPMFVSQKPGFVKATQKLAFEATLASKRSSYMLTQTDQATFKENFVNPNSVEISQKYKLGRDRFLKNKQEISKSHAYREINKIQKKKAIRKDLLEKNETEVKAYRSYRSGDFPDIQIKLSAVLKPLEVLANYDVNICRLLYSSLFDSAYEIANHKRETNIFFKEVGTGINNIFKSNVEFDAGLIKSLLEIAIKYKKYFTFNPDIITSVSLNSGLMSLGCLLLEEYLNEELYSDEPPKVKKMKGATNDLETLHWIKLAELYKSLEDWDMVHGIFSKMRYDQAELLKKIQNAFSAENQCLWMSAKSIYSEILSIDENEDRKDFYYVSYFNCLAELSEWNEVSKSIEQIVPVDNIWEDLWSVPWNRDKLLPYYITSQVRISLTDYDIKTDFMKNLKNLQKENLARKEYLLCNHSEELAFLGVIDGEVNLTKMYLETFIRNFLIDWNHINPSFTSLRAKKIMSIRSCMDINNFVTNYSKFNKSILNVIGKYWEMTSVENNASIVELDTRNMYRKEFSKILRRKVRRNEAFEEVVDNMNITLIECAIQQGNDHVAKKYFQQLTPQQSKYNLLQSKILYLGGRKDLNILLKSLEYLENYLKNIDRENNVQEYLSATLYQHELLNTASKLSNPNSNIISKLSWSMSFLSKPSKNIDDLAVQLLHNCIKSCEESENVSINLMGEAFYKLANYAKNVNNIKRLLSFSFKAIQYESIEGRLLFPYLLEVITEENVEQFVHDSSSVPNWMFIQWIPQMLAETYTGKAKAVSKILLSIAKEYPFAVQYSFRVSREKFTRPESIVMDEDRKVSIDVFNELESLLKNQEIDDLLEALSSVFLPLSALHNAVKMLYKEVKSPESFEKLRSEILKTFYGKQYDYYNNYSPRGKIFKAIRKYEDLIRKLNIDNENSNVCNKLQQLIQDTSKVESPTSEELGNYSPRLKYYRGSEIEIPGQYKGNGKPLPQYHVKIAGFSSKVKIMSSFRKPIAISILGSDTKEYNFLIKCGEDLRQDQRIQQLFNLMNDAIHSDPTCFKRNLKIVTYEVIPLTSNLGIIQFVKDVKQLNRFFDGHKHLKIMENVAPKVDKKKAIDIFRGYVDKVPSDILRKSFHKMSIDLENLFTLRHTFIRSYSVMCISNWLLGIGDRHLDNLLISTKTGEAIGIDFGQAFGFGVQYQPIPELVPFRLTPQIVNLMKPQKIEGTFQETMVHTLRALRRKSDILLATMDIFIKEPTLCWADVEKGNIEFARRKLNGEHSRIIMVDELKCRKESESVLEKYFEYVRGECNYVERMDVDGEERDVGENCSLSVESQIKGLLEHAVDENLLVRMYFGWRPWL